MKVVHRILVFLLYLYIQWQDIFSAIDIFYRIWKAVYWLLGGGGKAFVKFNGLLIGIAFVKFSWIIGNESGQWNYRNALEILHHFIISKAVW